MSKKAGKFIFAGLIGAIAGAVGGLLLAPQSGKETREEIAKMARNLSKQLRDGVKETNEKAKEVFGDVSKEAIEKYSQIKSTVASKVAAVKGAGQVIDKDKYGQIVDEVIKEYRDDFKVVKDGAEKMANQLKKDWIKIKKALS